MQIYSGVLLCSATLNAATVQISFKHYPFTGKWAPIHLGLVFLWPRSSLHSGPPSELLYSCAKKIKQCEKDNTVIDNGLRAIIGYKPHRIRRQQMIQRRWASLSVLRGGGRRGAGWEGRPDHRHIISLALLVFGRLTVNNTKCMEQFVPLNGHKSMIYPAFLTMIRHNNGVHIKVICIDCVSRRRPSIRNDMY